VEENVEEKPAGKKKTSGKKKKTKKASGPKKAILVESPTKIKTIKKFVKSKYKILATKGHIIDLPKSKLGVDVDNSFEPSYIVLRDKRKVLTELKKELKPVEEVFMATDPDREGEAICWHISEELKRSEKRLGVKKIHRVMFNEITKSAVLKGLENPMDININLVNAQQARRILDRLVGYKISPLLWGAIRKGLSAGRVQSVALKLIVDRQREIDSFNPVEYWSIDAKLENNGKESFIARLAEKDGEKIDLKNKEEADAAVAALKSGEYTITEVIKKERKRNPLPPFITSTLQQDAARKFRFTAQKTMVIAQQLYEGINIEGEGQVGLITYMRTDSLRVAAEAQAEALEYIKTEIGQQYAPETPNFYKSKKSAQDAHEAIRPTSAFRAPEKIKKDLDKDQFKVYSLIWSRFVSSQMTPAVFDDTRVKIQNSPYMLRANGSIQKFDGFLKVYQILTDNGKNGGNDEKEGPNMLPEVSEGEKLGLLELLPEQHFTQPPPAYTDATLVRALEEKDIGRPSTYAPIISTLVWRKYVDRKKSKFTPTELGIVISDVLLKSFGEIINEEFTAKMEDDLDRIEEGEVEWHELLRVFHENFKKLLENAEGHMEELKKEIEGDIKEKCEKCGSRMIIKWGRFGKFLSCEKYPECKNAKPLKGHERVEEKIDEKCPDCGEPLIIKQGPYGSFIACSKYPDCKYTRQILKKVGVACPDCGGDIIERTAKRRKKFYGCSNYPKCNFMVWDRPVNKKCSVCGAPFLLEKYKKDKVIVYCSKCDFKEEKENE